MYACERMSSLHMLQLLQIIVSEENPTNEVNGTPVCNV